MSQIGIFISCTELLKELKRGGEAFKIKFEKMDEFRISYAKFVPHAYLLHQENLKPIFISWQKQSLFHIQSVMVQNVQLCHGFVPKQRIVFGQLDNLGFALKSQRVY